MIYNNNLLGSEGHNIDSLIKQTTKYTAMMHNTPTIIVNTLKHRSWDHKFSILNRKCYITGKCLWLKWCFRGRKPTTNIMCRNKIINDDIWLSSEQFLHINSA